MLTLGYDFKERNYKILKKNVLKNLSYLEDEVHKIKKLKNPTYENTLGTLQKIENKINQDMSYLSQLYATVKNEKNSKLYQELKKEISKVNLKIGQDKLFFNVLKKIDKNNLNKEEEKVLENTLEDFKYSGISLPEEKKIEFTNISQKLNDLVSQFTNNVAYSTENWYLSCDEEDLKGMPENILENLKNESGNYVLNLRMPCYVAVMTHVENRDVREKVYEAYVSRASSGINDNSTVVVDILNERAKKSKLLGFENYAELSLSRKMANNTNRVIEFLGDLLEKSLGKALVEAKELEGFAKNNYNIEKLMPWDTNFIISKYKEKLFKIDEKEIMEFFTISNVLSGLFSVVNNLYGVSFVPIQFEKGWHDDVLFYELINLEKQPIGYILMDLFSRKEKRGGAWVDTFRNRMKLDNDVQLPIAFLNCNFNKSKDAKNSLLTHRNVVTLFHEMGHALHHCLTKVNELNIAGISGVEWDAVELPSQFNENFCYNKKVIKKISSHYKTKEKLSDEIIDKIINTKNFMSALSSVRQLEFSLLDLNLHLFDNYNIKVVEDIQNEVYKKTTVIGKVKENNNFINSFSHIFAGGYAAGYYSYKWSEVLSADVFESFLNEDHAIDYKKGKEFLDKILSKGGSEDTLKMFIDFKGREPNVDALLRSLGI